MHYNLLCVTSVVPILKPRTHTKLGTDIVNLWAKMPDIIDWNDIGNVVFNIRV
jgi:hypothetical protein